MKEPERMEALIASVHKYGASIATMEETLDQLVKELREPSSSELPELLKALIAQTQGMTIALTAQTKQIEAQSATVAQMGARISTLRDTIVKATGG